MNKWNIAGSLGQYLDDAFVERVVGVELDKMQPRYSLH